MLARHVSKKMSKWLVWTCGTPLNKFRDPEMHFQSSWTYVTHTYKFEATGAFNSLIFYFTCISYHHI